MEGTRRPREEGLAACQARAGWGTAQEHLHRRLSLLLLPRAKTGASADGPWGSAVPEAAGHTLRRHRPPSTQARFQLGEGAGELAVVGMTWTLQSDQWPACGAEHPEDRSPRAEGGRGRARPYSRRGCISARRDPGPAHVGLEAAAGRPGLQAPRAPLRPQWGCRLGP